MQLLQPKRDPQPVIRKPGQQQSQTPLTRHEFYQLAERCRDYALELAHYDQTRVDLQQCYKFNEWLPQLKSYDLLGPVLHTLRPARPVARWQVMVVVAALGFVLLLALASRSTRPMTSGFSFSYFLTLLLLYFVPERLYGTTIELLEGKVLRVVDALDALLSNGGLGFSEAAFFQAKENLEIARRELRQQIDLAHR